MASKILLLKVSADASLLECERAAQEFIVAANAVFFKAQAPHNKSKGKAKATEDDKDKEDEATRKLRKELKDFMVLTKFDDKLLASLLPPLSEYYEGDIELPMQKKHPPLAASIIAKHVKLVQAAKAFLEQQSKSPQFFILEGYKGKGKAKALLSDSEQMGTKRTFKLIELVDSDSDEEEEKRVHVIKKIKCKHVEELTGTRKRKEIIELEDEEVEIVAPKTPAVGLSCLTSKPMVLVLSAPKPIPKLIVALAFSVAGPSTASIVPSSASKPATAATLSKPVPVKFARLAIKGGFVFEDPFIVRQFKLTDTEESKTLCDEEFSNKDKDKDDNDDEDGKNGNDDSDNDDAAMDVDSAKHLEETWPMVPTKAMVTEVEVPVPVP
ncbi:hypothetical protein C0995_012811, partial [Termitomyces sp. Mi166